MTPVFQVVPALPPAINGVGDYAALLAAALRSRGVDSRFVTIRAAADERVDVLERRSPTALAAALESAERVVVHFSGYGYGSRGLCFWLVEGLERWRRQGRGRRLVTVFHELYATGPVWRTSFWTAPAQRWLACRLAMASDAMLATSAATAGRLQVWQPALRVETMAVFSNVGELAAPPAPKKRPATAVVFGGAHRARTWRALAAAAPEAGTALRAAGIAEIVDIGPGLGSIPSDLNRLPICVAGPLPAAEVSALLTRARVGIADYPRHVMTKSGILAAYFAHGMLCVNTSGIGDLPDDLAEGREFVSLTGLAGGSVDVEAVAAAGHRWYRGHDVAATAALVHDLIA